MQKPEVFDVQWLLRPCVYAWKRHSTYLYIGFSAKGLCRPFGDHNVLNKSERFQLEDTIEVWQFDNASEARKLERKLIRLYKPCYNKASEEELRCKGCGHVWLSRTQRPLKCPSCQSCNWNGSSAYPRPVSKRGAAEPVAAKRG